MFDDAVFSHHCIDSFFPPRYPDLMNKISKNGIFKVPTRQQNLLPENSIGGVYGPDEVFSVDIVNNNINHHCTTARIRKKKISVSCRYSPLIIITVRVMYPGDRVSALSSAASRDSRREDFVRQ